jgi:HTH-type transcriptional regulator/antitoxin HigA
MVVESTQKTTQLSGKVLRRSAAGGRRKTNRVPAAYLRLVEQFRLRPIESDQELAQAIAVVDQLTSKKRLLPEEEEYLAVLSDLIEKYEEEHVRVADMSAAEMLRFLIEQRGTTQQAVAREAGIAGSTISAVLHGSRELTRRQIERLAPYFGVAPAVFLPGND